MSSATDMGCRVIDLVSGVLRTATTHETRNDAVLRLIQELLGLVRTRPGRADVPMVLLIHDTDVFVDQELLRLDLQTWQRARALGDALATQGANELRILPTATVEDLAEFFRLLGQAVRMRRPDPRLVDVARFRTAISQRAIDVQAAKSKPKSSVLLQFCSLRVVCDEFFERTRMTGSAPVVVVRRAMQAAADEMLTAPDAWLALLLVPPEGDGPGRHAARAAALAAFFSGQLGAGKAATSRAALLALRAAVRGGGRAETTGEGKAESADLDARSREYAVDAALGLVQWPSGVALPTDAGIAALSVAFAQQLWVAAQSRQTVLQAFQDAVRVIEKNAQLPAGLVKRVQVILGPTPPGTIIVAPVAGVVCGRRQVLVGPPAATISVEQGHGVCLGAQVPGPWTGWLAHHLA